MGYIPSEARKKFALNLKPSTDTVLQSADLCVLKMFNYLYEIFHIFKVSLLHEKRWWSIKSLWPEPGATEVGKYKGVGSCVTVHVWGECECGLDQTVTAHTALLPSDIFYVLVLFLLYFDCLLNGFFWLCFV